MSAFTVQLESRPGELARLCEIMAEREINLLLCAVAHGDRGTIAFVVDDERATREALANAGIEYTEREALTVRMENHPGAGAVTFRRLAQAGVNLELLLPVQVSKEEFFAVLGVDDASAARAALGDQLVAGPASAGSG